MALPEEQRVERELEVRVGDVADAEVLKSLIVGGDSRGRSVWMVLGGLMKMPQAQAFYLDGHLGQKPRVEHAPRGVAQRQVHHAGGGGEGGGGLEQRAQEVGGLAVIGIVGGERCV